ncbi:TPA: hypothetical protein GRI54_18820 [Vibrio parahaemolyticus]|uniref:hypothetical protein n=1 Tax=Vibrio parahaemolyticus TaxID=670 RepID=UPI001A19AB04|nr:hypothetical protein [Vibrio parahaemolyticus]HAS6550358.1 hypothetical protein [Vibrio parahaemolyticus]HAS6735488.1 hypothetical protein [Vibrio parahaemolyticus]HAS6846127.1 hypothetical protein [Vibrio parahaemolyticus]
MSSLNEYWEALERLSTNEPIRVPKGSSINNDTVAIEAGRKRGSIKKSRPSFSALIDAIAEKADKGPHIPSTAEKLKAEKYAKNSYRERYHQALNRELMLIERIAQLEKEIENLKKVSPFKR